MAFFTDGQIKQLIKKKNLKAAADIQRSLKICLEKYSRKC